MALDLLQLHGLVCRVPGYAHWVHVASEFSACFFTDPERDLQHQVPSLGLPDEVGLPGVAVFRPQPGAADAKIVPKMGAKLLAPWIDHKGGLNVRLWTSLVRRLMSIVMSTPGTFLKQILALEISRIFRCKNLYVPSMNEFMCRDQGGGPAVGNGGPHPPERQAPAGRAAGAGVGAGQRHQIHARRTSQGLCASS